MSFRENIINSGPNWLSAMDRPEFTFNNSIVFPFERDFDTPSAHAKVVEMQPLTYSVAALYLSFLFIGIKFMEVRKPVILKNTLILWNVAQAIFSIIGTTRTLPELIFIISKFGLFDSVCTHFNGHGTLGFWFGVFIFSKFFDLIETTFLVLRKRVVFLHWFHHAISFIATWYLATAPTSMSRWFVAMNFSVHSVMYTYFALAAMGFRLPKALAMTITSVQIVQMFLGFFVSIAAFHYNSLCETTLDNSIVGILLYGSFVISFGNFFIHSYIVKNNKSTKKIN